MKFTGSVEMVGTVKVSEIRNALADMDLEDISALGEDATLRIEDVRIDQHEVNEACGLCAGEGVPDPEPQVSERLITDFIAAINAGDLVTAGALVGRVFEDGSDIRTVDNAICRCAA